jgi:hypothetical protein
MDCFSRSYIEGEARVCQFRPVHEAKKTERRKATHVRQPPDDLIHLFPNLPAPLLPLLLTLPHLLYRFPHLNEFLLHCGLLLVQRRRKRIGRQLERLEQLGSFVVLCLKGFLSRFEVSLRGGLQVRDDKFLRT